MGFTKKVSKTYAEKCDLIADQLLKMMEGNTIPWRKSWKTNLPQSVSGREYHGYNMLICALAPYSDPRWITFEECKKRGGNVKAGQKSTRIYWWEFFDGKPDSNGKVKKIPYCKLIPVFNVEQCEGLTLKDLEALKPRHDCTPLENAEKFIASLPWNLEIKNCNTPCFKHNDPDAVYMPPASSFASMDLYYVNLFHEVAHASGDANRLNREKLNYAEEELVAEFTAAFICATLGIDSTDLTLDSAAYLQGWAKKIKEDKAIVMRAATAAKKAASYLLQNYLKQEETQEPEDLTLAA